MQVTQHKKNGLNLSLTIKIPAEKVGKQIESKLIEIGSKANIPGFRVGKVPLPILKKRYQAAVTGEVLEQNIRESYEAALKEKNISPANQPKIDIKDYKEGADLEYTVELETLPEISEIDYSKIHVSRHKIIVDPSRIDNALQTVAKQHSEKKELKAKRPVKDGDIVTIDFEGKIDNIAFPGGTAKAFDLTIGSGQFIPGFEAQLIGKKIGDDVAVNVTFPKAYQAENLAGKEAVFDVKIHNIQELSLPKIDDELAKKTGFTDLAKLKDDISARISVEFENVTFGEAKKELLDSLSSLCNFEIPESLLNQEFSSIWKQIEEAKKNNTLDDEDKCKPDIELKKDYEDVAKRRIKLGLLLAEIGKKNDIQVSHDEVNRLIGQEIARYPDQKDNIIKFYSENPEMLANIQGPLFEDKVVEFIFSKANVKTIEISAEEFFKKTQALPTKKKSKKTETTKSSKESASSKKENTTKAKTVKKATSTVQKKESAKKS